MPGWPAHMELKLIRFCFRKISRPSCEKFRRHDQEVTPCHLRFIPPSTNREEWTWHHVVRRSCCSVRSLALPLPRPPSPATPLPASPPHRCAPPHPRRPPVDSSSISRTTRLPLRACPAQLVPAPPCGRARPPCVEPSITPPRPVAPTSRHPWLEPTTRCRSRSPRGWTRRLPRPS